MPQDSCRAWRSKGYCEPERMEDGEEHLSTGRPTLSRGWVRRLRTRGVDGRSDEGEREDARCDARRSVAGYGGRAARRVLLESMI